MVLGGWLCSSLSEKTRGLSAQFWCGQVELAETLARPMEDLMGTGHQDQERLVSLEKLSLEPWSASGGQHWECEGQLHT